MLGISDSSTTPTSSLSKKLPQWQSSTIKQMFWLDYFFCISCYLSDRRSFQYNNKLLSWTIVRAFGDASKKYWFSKKSKILRKINVTWYFLGHCAVTCYLFWKKAKPATELKNVLSHYHFPGNGQNIFRVPNL